MVNTKEEVSKDNMLKQLISPFINLEVRSQEELLADFRAHYTETESYIRNLIYWMIRSEEANDLVQITYLKAWKNYSSFNNKSKFRTWVHRIAMNTSKYTCAI